MRSVFLIWFLGALASAWGGEVRLQALAEFESNNQDRAVGPAGERSRYQIMPYVWREYSRSRAYSDPKVARDVALRIARDRVVAFERARGRKPDHQEYWLLWCAPGTFAGVAYNKSRMSTTLRAKATRFANLAGKINEQRHGK